MPDISVTITPVTQTTVINPTTATILTEIASSAQTVVTEAGNINVTEVSTLLANLSIYVPRSESGQFYPSSNPSGFATGIDGSSFVTKSSTGIFVTTGQTGLFISVITGASPTINLLSVPISVNVYGGTSKLLGNPSGFLAANLSGQSIRIPYYL